MRIFLGVTFVAIWAFIAKVGLDVSAGTFTPWVGVPLVAIGVVVCMLILFRLKIRFTIA